DAVMTAVVENDWEVPVYYHPPQLVPEKPPLLQPLTLNPTTVPYLIITNDQIAGMVDAFQPFAEWLTDKGVPALVYPLSQALNQPGEDDAEKLRNFIIQAYNNWGTAWVLLGGDGYVTSGAGPNCVVPFRKGWAYDDTVSGADDDVNTPPSDLYFSDMNGNWDVDGDNRWGEPTHDVVDIYPEVFVGRILARNSVEVNNWVQKILQYEQEGSADPLRLEQTTWIYDALGGLEPFQQTRNRFPLYFTHHNCNSVYANIVVESLNVSSGLYQIYCHGYSDKFLSRLMPSACSVMAHYDGVPGSDIDGLNHLNNENRYYVVYSISCYNAAYDQFVNGDGYPTDTTIADAFIDVYAGKGAAAFLGNTRWGWVGSSHYLHDAFCQYFFQGGVYSLGVAEGLSKNFCRAPIPGQPPPSPPRKEWYVTHSHNLFGSPENEPWINTPGAMDVQHPDFIPVEQPVVCTVTVTAGGNPLEFVRVCLHKPDDIYEIGWTDNSGSVTFDLYAETLGTIKVTCFRPREGTTQYLPSQTSCEVVSDEEGGQAGKSGLPKELFLTIASPISAFSNIRLSYGLPKDERVQLAVYDLSGRTTMVLKDEMKKAGYYSETFNLSRLSNGIYWLVLKSGGETRTRKLVLVK
ncbi:MAG: C25 family cysteine peptidase, partial [candidate division WOR-3 bacterium]